MNHAAEILLLCSLLCAAAGTLLLFAHRRQMKIWQCPECSQFHDEAGNQSAFRPPAAEYCGSKFCELCERPALRLGWDHGSRQTLAEYYGNQWHTVSKHLQDGGAASTKSTGAPPHPAPTSPQKPGAPS